MSKENKPLEGSQPSRKLGVKFLDKHQLDNTFPDWKALFARIDEQRAISHFASENHYYTGQEHLPQTYDNVYGILGERGSGKSSVLLTLRQFLEQNEPQDIMFPIITPEVISGQECSILGWVMSAAEAVVEDVEHRICKQGRPFVHDPKYSWLDDFFADCQFKKNDNGLRKHYEELFPQSIGHGPDLSGYSVEDAVYYKVEQSRKQYQLIRNLNEFWRQLSRIHALANALPAVCGGESGAPCASDKTPLIILAFDDIDLVPERSMELLTTTFQYLTAPNIVILLTASEPVLKDVIRLKMVERMIGSDSASLLQDFFPKEIEPSASGKANKDLCSPIEKMTDEFYNKVLPPSSRYYLLHYRTIEDRKLYSYSSTAQSFTPPKESPSIPIDVFLSGQVDELLQTLQSVSPEKYSNKRNFLQSGEDLSSFRDAYLLMLGQKNRNIANGCLEIMNTVTRLQDIISAHQGWQMDESNYQNILFTLRHLLRALLLSNPDLVEFSDSVSTLLRSRRDSHWIYVDYLFIWDFYQQKRTEIINELFSKSGPSGNLSSISRHPEFSAQLGSLKQKLCSLILTLFFIEGLLGILDSKNRDIHGYRELSSLMNADTMVSFTSGVPLRLFPLRSTVNDFLDRSQLVLEHASQYVNADLFNPRKAHAYLVDTFGTKVTPQSASKLLSYAVSHGDREWAKTVLVMLSVCFSGITLVDWHLVRISETSQRILELFPFGGHFNKSQKNAVLHFLSNRSISDTSKKLLREFAEHITEASHDELDFDQFWSSLAPSKPRTLTEYFDSFSFQQKLENSSSLYLQRTNQRDMQTERFLYAYAVRRWQTVSDADGSRDLTKVIQGEESLMALSHQIVRFFRLLLDECVKSISNHTYLLLSYSSLTDIRMILRHIDEYSHDLKRKKDTLLELIDRTLSSPKYSKMKGNEQEPDTVSITLPSRSFIDYLATLQTTIFTPGLQPRSHSMFYEHSDVQSYFELLQYLNLVDHPYSDKLLLVPEKPYSSLVCQEIVSTLKTLELLMPYYFAASTWISQGTRYRSELLWSEDSLTLDAVDTTLKNLFNSLIPDKPKSRNRKSLLSELMNETQAELAEEYYNQLEASYE